MVKSMRLLASLVLAAGVAACEPTTGVDVTSTQEAVLPATESSKDFGEYVVFFNALNTDQLTPDIAREYGIVRSKSRAMLNVSVHRKNGNGMTEAVTGTVTASATNLNGQFKSMTLREVREEAAIYYIGELAITDGEVLIYTVNAMPSDEQNPFTLRFQKQFFVEEG